MKNLLEDLNKPQKEAVLCVDGPLLVLAGAGSGKTKALTHRIAYLIKEKNVSPYNILAVTFTNKASREMGERVSRLLGPAVIPVKTGIQKTIGMDSGSQITGRNDKGGVGADDLIRLPWLGTFHSVCVKILRREAQHLGYERSFTIYDSGDSLSVIKKIIKELSIDPKQFSPSAIRHFISGAKNELIDAKGYKKYTNSPFEEMTSKVFDKYEKRLKDANAMDFDDLLMQCVILFQNNSTVLEYYQNLFKYVLIDEYQDTNHAQYLWVKLLAEKHKNIMVVGDDSQSIYAFRGANFKNILNFEKHYPNAKIVKLEQNYRSTKTIIAASNEVIRCNKHRTDKTLWTDNSEGLPITVYEALNEKDEAEFVYLEIRSLLRNHELSDFTVLYRTNAQSRAIEEVFLRHDMPYRVVGGFRFYERKEIKDIIAYLRLITNHYDQEALARAICAPLRGIGPKTLEQVGGVSYTATGEEFDRLPTKVRDFYNILKEINKQSEDIRLDDLILLIASKTGYKASILDGTDEGDSRWENIQELAGIAGQVELEVRNGDQALEASVLELFLERVALVQDTDKLDQNEKAVTLMTLHSAKGLEFDTVFIVGVEEGIFPHSRSLMDESEMEEERRLAYVGITRAKERLYLIHASERNIYGCFQSNPKSRFIENIPEELIDEL